MYSSGLLGTKTEIPVNTSEWDSHWKTLDSTRPWFSLAAVATRRFIFQPVVAHYANRFFREIGIFVEMGCGTAYSSTRITNQGRRLIGLDFSAVALKIAQDSAHMDALIRATIFATPFRSDSIDGIWNLGVMEHFSESEIQRSLQEFRRVLKPDGVIILFWPAEKNLSRWILGPIESFVTGWRRAKFTFFPGEITQLKSKHQAQLFLE